MADTTLTSKKCSHPENRRGFDTGIEWCIDCQAIMDEKGNFVHQTAEVTDAPQVLSASAECPLCGHEGPHPHTPLEQVIYRNGVKAGKAHGNETGECHIRPHDFCSAGTCKVCVDAARYRFLHHPGNAIVYAKDRNAWGEGGSGWVRWETSEQLDAAVDAALAHAQKANEGQT